MKTLKIGDNIRMISLGGVDSNIYVVDGCMLIDTGTGLRKEELDVALKEAGVSHDEITSIVNTHGHFDHIGGNGLFGNAKILAHDLCADVIEGADNMKSYAHWFGGALEKLDCVRLKDNDIVRAGDTKLDVIHAPGHSDGSICLFDKKSGVLFSGDVIFKNGYGRTDLSGGDGAKLRGTLRKLSQFEVKKILPGHGGIIEGGSAHIRATIDVIRA
ncbi:MAG: MBL fold metallo-hydrolase [Candidatus Aenigmarchaeota archaeon]|nr:MBL fold metallo-hydrolase [Candidatus Aenigmarchaeota archaeon]